MLRLSKLILSIVSLIFISTALKASELPHISLSTMLQDSAPKYLRLDDGSYGGLAVEIMKAMEKADGNLQFEYREQGVPFPRIVQELQHGRIDVFFGAIHNAEREKLFDYLKPELYSTNNRFFARASDSVLGITSLKELQQINDIILVDRATAHQRFLESIPGLRLDGSATTREQNLQKLISERGRFYYSTDFGVLHTARTMGVSQQIQLLPFVLASEPQYLVVSKQLSPEAKLRLQKALEKIADNGELEKILNTYFNN